MAGLGGWTGCAQRGRDACGPAPAEGPEETAAWIGGRISHRITGMTGADALRTVHDMLSASFVLPVVGDPVFASNGVTLPMRDLSATVTSIAIGCLEGAGVACAGVDGMFGTDPDTAVDRRWLQADTGDGWHHIDIAGDILLSAVRAPVRYDYCGLSDSEISTDHIIGAAPHGCPASGCDHYSANGLYVDDFDAFRAILAESLRKKRPYLAVRLPRGVRPDEMQKKLTIASAEVCCKHVRGKFEMGTSLNAAQMVFVVTVVREARRGTAHRCTGGALWRGVAAHPSSRQDPRNGKEYFTWYRLLIFQ